jgi:hypothetical protein
MRAAVVIGIVALALAGCGAEELASGTPPAPKGDFGPTEPGTGTRARPDAPPLAKPSAPVAAALAAGTVGVVGVEGDVGVRPRALEISADGTLSGLRWEEWGDGSARGAGTLRLRDCDPTCASGNIDAFPATVTLSSPRLCGRATYFDRARVEVSDAAPPTTYVRAPC